jgi:hypothetical protein
MNDMLEELTIIVKSGLERTIYLVEYIHKLEKRIEALENKNAQELEHNLEQRECEERWKVYGEE